MSIKNIIQVSRELYRNRSAYPKPFRKKTALEHYPAEAARSLKNDGVFVIENYLSREECARLCSVIDEAWKKIPAAEAEEIRTACLDTKKFTRGVERADGCKYWIDRHDSDHRIIGAEKLDTGIMKINQDAAVKNLGEHHLGISLVLQFSMANKVVFREANTGSGGGWHRDNCYAHGFKCMLYLTDVGADDGPFQYIPGTHRNAYHLFVTNTIGKYQFAHDEMEALVKKRGEKMIDATASAGSLLVFNTNILHRGKPIASGHQRYAITNYYDFGKTGE